MDNTDEQKQWKPSEIQKGLIVGLIIALTTSLFNFYFWNRQYALQKEDKADEQKTIFVKEVTNSVLSMNDFLFKYTADYASYLVKHTTYTKQDKKHIVDVYADSVLDLKFEQRFYVKDSAGYNYNNDFQKLKVGTDEILFLFGHDNFVDENLLDAYVDLVKNYKPENIDSVILKNYYEGVSFPVDSLNNSHCYINSLQIQEAVMEEYRLRFSSLLLQMESVIRESDY